LLRLQPELRLSQRKSMVKKQNSLKLKLLQSHPVSQAKHPLLKKALSAKLEAAQRVAEVRLWLKHA